MASGSGKKSLKQKFSSAARKVLLTFIFAGAVGGSAYYEYATKEQDVTVISQSSNIITNADGQPVGNYEFYTDKGVFIAEKSRFHLQSQKDAKSIYDKINNNTTYHITTYGLHIGGNWQPNILEARAVTAEELAARAAAQKAAQIKENAVPPQNSTPTPSTGNAGVPATGSTGAGNQQSCTQPSGDMATIEKVINGYHIQLRVPVEVAGKVSVTTVGRAIPDITPPTP